MLITQITQIIGHIWNERYVEFWKERKRLGRKEWKRESSRRKPMHFILINRHYILPKHIQIQILFLFVCLVFFPSFLFGLLRFTGDALNHILFYVVNAVVPLELSPKSVTWNGIVWFCIYICRLTRSFSVSLYNSVPLSMCVCMCFVHNFFLEKYLFDIWMCEKLIALPNCGRNVLSIFSHISLTYSSNQCWGATIWKLGAMSLLAH